MVEERPQKWDLRSIGPEDCGTLLRMEPERNVKRVLRKGVLMGWGWLNLDKK